MSGTPVYQQTVILGSTDEPQHVKEPNCRKAFKVTGILHFVLGALNVLLGIVAIVIKAKASYFATPIWTAVLFFMSTGILSIQASRRNKSSLRVAYLCMSIITSVVAFTLVIIYSTFVAAENDLVYDPNSRPPPSYYNHHYVKRLTRFSPRLTHICDPGIHKHIVYSCENVEARSAVDGLIILTSFLEGIVCIVGAVYSCVATCRCCRDCCKPSPPPGSAYYSTNAPIYRGSQSGGPVYVQVPQVANPYTGGQAAVVVPQGYVAAPASQPVAMYVTQPANAQFQQKIPDH